MSLLISTIIRILMVFTVSIICGWLMFGALVFEVNHPAFGFIILPVIGSILFSLNLENKKRDLIFALIILFLLDIFVTTTFNFQMIFTHFNFIMFLTLGIILYTGLYNKLVQIPYVRPFILASFLAIVFPIANTVLWFIFTPDNIYWHLFQNLPYGFVMGLSIGMGLEISELIISGKYINKIWNA